ncbi:MAG: PilW family protein [Rhodocyclaceae bacterium]|jgi:type IV pilus assembly protein PilW|nr:PilW family protein [Rhodocyclaceae bacterium]
MRAMSPLTSRGFSLIELLVALVIAMIGTIAIMQVYISGEAGKRALGSLGEAQSGALVALYQIEREMQRAGYGFLDRQALGCNIRSSFAGFNNLTLQPVSIVPDGAAVGHIANRWGIPPGDPGSDMLIISAGNGATLIEGSRLALAANAGDGVIHLVNKSGISAGAYLLIAEAGQDCTLTKASLVNPPNVDDQVQVQTPMFAGYSTDNARVMQLTVPPQPLPPPSSQPKPSFVVYTVRNGMLTRCDFTASNCADAGAINNPQVWTPVANDVVALVAQYGFDTSTPADGVVDAFCKTRLTPGGSCPGSDTGLTDAPGSDADQTVRAEDWSRVLAIQLAVVTRSGQAEKDPVSPVTLKLWPDNANAADGPLTQGPVWNVPDQYYRYRVARTIVPLRNVIWQGGQR